MAASLWGERCATGVRESGARALVSVLEARVAHLKGTAVRAEGLPVDEGTDGAAEFAAAAAQHEIARRALERVD